MNDGQKFFIKSPYLFPENSAGTLIINASLKGKFSPMPYIPEWSTPEKIMLGPPVKISLPLDKELWNHLSVMFPSEANRLGLRDGW